MKARSKVIIIIFVLIIIGLSVYLYEGVFLLENFRIDNKTGKYNNEEIIRATDLKIGEKITFLSTDKVKEKIEKNLPYADKVKVSKNPFSKTLTIKVVKAKEKYSLIYNKKNYILNEKYKILDIRKKDKSLLILKGISVTDVDLTGAEKKSLVGSYKSNKDFLKKFCTLKNDMQIGKVFKFSSIKSEYIAKVGKKVKKMGCVLNKVDYTDNKNLVFIVDKQYEVHFGSVDKFERKFEVLSTAMKSIRKKHGDEKGIIDASVYDESSKFSKVHYYAVKKLDY